LDADPFDKVEEKGKNSPRHVVVVITAGGRPVETSCAELRNMSHWLKFEVP